MPVVPKKTMTRKHNTARDAPPPPKKNGCFSAYKIWANRFGQQIRSFGQTLTSKSVNLLVNYTI